MKIDLGKKTKISGLYFLMSEGRVIYIGITTNFIGRIADHIEYGKIFDSCRLIECPMSIAKKYEQRWIMRYVELFD